MAAKIVNSLHGRFACIHFPFYLIIIIIYIKNLRILYAGGPAISWMSKL